MDKASAISLNVDYSATRNVAAVYTEVAVSHIKSSRSLKILSYVHGKSDLAIPSWVPDWTMAALPLLPRIQSDSSEISSGRSVRVADVQPFYGRTPLELRVFGQRLGSVLPEGNLFPRPRSQHPWYGRHGGENEWCFKPSTNITTRICPERRHFWETISSLGQPGSTCTDMLYFPMDIPPSFGGLCSGCYSLDTFQGKEKHLKFLKPYGGWQLEEAARKLGDDRRLACFCCGRTHAWHIDIQLEKPQRAEAQSVWDSLEESDDRTASHYYRSELRDFEEKLYQNRRGRALFATEYTLGLGPENIKEGDEVWLLDGAEVPVVLRPTLEGDHHTVVGECYLHAGLRKKDTCARCGAETVRSFAKFIRRVRDGRSRYRRPTFQPELRRAPDHWVNEVEEISIR